MATHAFVSFKLKSEGYETVLSAVTMILELKVKSKGSLLSEITVIEIAGPFAVKDANFGLILTENKYKLISENARIKTPVLIIMNI